MERSDKGLWAPIVFGLPFIGVGAFFALTGFEVFPLPGPKANAPLWVLGCIGVAFLASGLLVTGVGIRGRMTSMRRDETIRMHPNQPWMIDYDWDREGIRAGGFGNVVGGIYGLALFCTFLAPFHWWAWMSPAGGLFVKVLVVGLEFFAFLFALSVLRNSLRWLQYGQSKLRFAQFPFHPGERLEVEFSPNRFDRLHVTLRFRKRQAARSGTGESANTRIVDDTLYEAEQSLDCSALDAEVSIAFDLPANDEWVNSIAAEPSYAWALEIKAEAPGVDFEESFLLPVYASERSKAQGRSDTHDRVGAYRA